MRIVVHVRRRCHVLQQVQHSAEDPEGRPVLARAVVVPGELIQRSGAVGGIGMVAYDARSSLQMRKGPSPAMTPLRRTRLLAS